MTIIYHGTPLTPRDALQSVCAGRAMCVSFFRPDDVEVVEAISPAIMFRQRRVLGMAVGPEARRGMVHPRGLDTVLRLAGAKAVRTWQVGGDTGCARSAQPAQRQPALALALRRSRSAALAHGWADRSPAEALRQVPSGLSRLDRGRKATGPTGLPRTHGGSRPSVWEQVADNSHDARDRGGPNMALLQRGWNEPRSERMAV